VIASVERETASILAELVDRQFRIPRELFKRIRLRRLVGKCLIRDSLGKVFFPESDLRDGQHLGNHEDPIVAGLLLGHTLTASYDKKASVPPRTHRVCVTIRMCPRLHIFIK